MAIPNYISNVENTGITGGAGVAVMERVKNLTWSYPDGTVLEDGNDNKEKPEFIRVVKTGRVEFSFECRDVSQALTNYNAGGCTDITFKESDAKDTQTDLSRMTVKFMVDLQKLPTPIPADGDVQWLGIEHNVAWGELASSTLRGVADKVYLDPA